MRKILITILVVVGLICTINSVGQQQTLNISPVKVQLQQVNLRSQVCNITHFQFQGQASLGNNDQLKRTFQKLGQKIQSLNPVTWQVNSTATYRIYQANPTFTYRDSKQKAEITGNNTIIIDGGFAEVAIQFKWTKTGSQFKNGTAMVFGLSDQIMFAKDIIIEGGFFKYDLLEYRNVTFDNPMSFTRFTPSDMSEQDQKNVLKLVNNLLNITTLRHQLQDQISLSYGFILKMNLHQQTQPIDQHFEYNWIQPTSQKSNLAIKFTRRPQFISVETDGIHYGYQAKIDGFANSKCGKGAPNLPMNPRIYGESQEFVAYQFYQNVIRYAIQKGQLNTVLNRKNWENKMFQFFAGDLYQLFPAVAQKFTATAEVTGDCQANTDHLLVYKSDLGNDAFNVSIHNKCQLNVNRTKILDFQVGLELAITGKPVFDHIDFVIKAHTQFVNFFEYGQYKMQNHLLAKQMISHSINRLYDSKLFGSGWPIFPVRDYPHFEGESDATFVYDSSHVKSIQI